MKRIKMQVAYSDGTKTTEVTAWTNGVPGLAVHRSVMPHGGISPYSFRCTHIPSGLTLRSGWDTRAGAMAFMEKVGPLQDWNRPADQIDKSKTIVDAIIAAFRETGGNPSL